ncbi:hypothetical protein TNCV_2043771 [Trichonephila clavipes]|nr:hypothetical protein TNCV_2043771 [Trichonephila clavipes]
MWPFPHRPYHFIRPNEYLGMIRVNVQRRLSKSRQNQIEHGFPCQNPSRRIRNVARDKTIALVTMIQRVIQKYIFSSYKSICNVLVFASIDLQFRSNGNIQNPSLYKIAIHLSMDDKQMMSFQMIYWMHDTVKFGLRSNSTVEIAQKMKYASSLLFFLGNQFHYGILGHHIYLYTYENNDRDTAHSKSDPKAHSGRSARQPRRRNAWE